MPDVHPNGTIVQYRALPWNMWEIQNDGYTIVWRGSTDVYRNGYTRESNDLIFPVSYATRDDWCVVTPCSCPRHTEGPVFHGNGNA